MKTIEFNPDGKPLTIPPSVSAADEASRKEILVEVLPLIFHKLKNKLTPILGYTQILISRNSDEFTRERLARIERNSAELTELLNSLKEYCKFPSGGRQPADINAIVEGLAPQWQSLSSSASARVVLELAAGFPELPLHAGQVRILLLNMADNAASALKMKNAAEREIRLATRLEGSSLKLLIRDNGIGMSEDELGNIWTPFYSKFPEHAGLGLVICEKILANHGAAFTVSSRPGEFFQFETRFPIPDAPAKGQNRNVENNPGTQS